VNTPPHQFNAFLDFVRPLSAALTFRFGVESGYSDTGQLHAPLSELVGVSLLPSFDRLVHNGRSIASCHSARDAAEEILRCICEAGKPEVIALLKAARQNQERWRESFPLCKQCTSKTKRTAPGGELTAPTTEGPS
jgi:hypothetical protein